MFGFFILPITTSPALMNAPGSGFDACQTSLMELTTFVMETSMSVESATQNVQVNVGGDLSTAIIQGIKVEVSPDSNVVVYTNDGVQTKAAPVPGQAAAKGTHISISEDFNTIVLNGATIERAADGHLVISTPGIVITKPAPADDSGGKAAHEIGDIERAGEHKGEIYGGIYPADNKPIWFSAAPKVMDHYKAAAWAQGQGGSLPTRKQGDYLTTLKGKGGAFTELFNRGGSFPAGYVWLAEPGTLGSYYAWCQRLSDGDQGDDFRDIELPVLSVRR
jgi:hypothetical protein